MNWFDFRGKLSFTFSFWDEVWKWVANSMILKKTVKAETDHIWGVTIKLIFFNIFLFPLYIPLEKCLKQYCYSSLNFLSNNSVVFAFYLFHSMKIYYLQCTFHFWEQLEVAWSKIWRIRSSGICFVAKNCFTGRALCVVLVQKPWIVSSTNRTNSSYLFPLAWWELICGISDLRSYPQILIQSYN